MSHDCQLNVTFKSSINAKLFVLVNKDIQINLQRTSLS